MITTSGDPEKCGKGKHIPEFVDAISSASVNEKVEDVVSEALQLIMKKLK
jgi:hypothetical protein